MGNSQFTHEGQVIGCDARTPNGYGYWVELRETKQHWITPQGTKWKKKNGYMVNVTAFPIYRLDLQSIKRVT